MPRNTYFLINHNIRAPDHSFRLFLVVLKPVSWVLRLRVVPIKSRVIGVLKSREGLLKNGIKVSFAMVLKNRKIHRETVVAQGFYVFLCSSPSFLNYTGF